ncbi:MAG: HlyD family efflux transporter periplasmic adaptor subunit [Candidatus Gracilibacteria bacterium]|nr:HlyD family efflux transporter periplasmic adaptor subunit [Candidatus Gracilibacteria bacterium]
MENKISKKLIASIIITGLFLTSCGGGDATEVPEANGEGESIKTAYNIETKQLKDFSKTVSIEKNGRISGSQDITLNAQASGRVSKIYKKEGDAVVKGQTVVAMSDTVGNYGIRLEQARNSLNKAKLSYDSSVISLDKAVNDSKLSLDQTETKYESTKQVIKKNLEQAKSNLETSDLTSEDSKASLDIKNQEANLEKAKFDYDTLLKNNQETLDSNKRSLSTQYDTFITSYNNIHEEMDKILGYTSKNQNENDDFQELLGAIKPSTLTEANNEFKILDDNKDKFNSLSLDTSSDEKFKAVLMEIDGGYKIILDTMDAMDTLIKESLYTDTALASQKQIVTNYVSSSQGNYNGFVTFKNNVTTFLNTYKNNEQSQKLALDIQEKNLQIAKLNSQKTDSDTQISYDQAIANAKDQLKTIETSLATAKTNYENAKKNREITLKQNKAAIVDAEISLKEAQRNYNNLFIKSPISGTISEINVDLGQELSSGTPAFKVVSNAKQEVEISLSIGELDHVKLGDKVDIVYQNQTITGTVKSVSKVADANLNYKVVITVDTPVSIIGESVEVIIKFEANNHLLPINIVTTTDGNTGFIYIINSENSLEKKTVEFAQIWGNTLELSSELSEETKIILTEMKNYDENKHNLVVK